jgi:hypothetical protein
MSNSEKTEGKLWLRILLSLVWMDELQSKQDDMRFATELFLGIVALLISFIEIFQSVNPVLKSPYSILVILALVTYFTYILFSYIKLRRLRANFRKQIDEEIEKIKATP